jgi:hypothetical protein
VPKDCVARAEREASILQSGQTSERMSETFAHLSMGTKVHYGSKADVPAFLSHVCCSLGSGALMSIGCAMSFCAMSFCAMFSGAMFSGQRLGAPKSDLL